MSRIFISHSSRDNFAARAIANWLAEEGWGPEDIFLDIDRDSGIAPGERWEKALHDAASRCEAVLILISRAWLSSDWCLKEMRLAQRLNKRIFAVLIEDIPVGDLPSEISAQWQVGNLAVGTDHRQFEVELPDGRRGFPTFSESGLKRLRTGLEDAGLDAKFFDWPPPDDPLRAPYRGLAPMEAGDAGIFYGRDAPLVEVMDLLRGLRDSAAPRMFAILGASGAGKSSFLRAGLLPRLARDDRNFRVLPIVRPERDALWGDNGLLAALAGALATANIAVTRKVLRTAIEAGGSDLAGWFRQLAPVAGSPSLVLPIDQGEELFGTEGRTEADRFLALVRALSETADLPLIVLFTIRSDSYERLQTAPQLEGLRPRTYGLGPMPRGAYQLLIEGPARRFAAKTRRLTIDPRLTTRLLADLEDGGGSDTLPLLAFTLERLFLEHGEDGDLTYEEYVEFNGVNGAIDTAVLQALKTADSDPAVVRDPAQRLIQMRRGLIPWLAGIDPTTRRPRRRVALFSDIPPESRPLMQHLVDVRLLSVGVNSAGEKTIEPTHEALFRQWGQLKGWLEEDAAVLATLASVQDAARDWAANARDPAYLVHTGARLVAAEGLNQRPDLAANLNSQERDYLGACRAAEDDRRDRELAEAKRLAEAETLAATRQREVARRTRVGLIAASVLAIVAIGFGAFGWLNFQEAERQRSVADEQRQIADERNTELEKNAAALQEAARQSELQSAQIATALVPSLVADGQLDQALLVLLETLRVYGDDTPPAALNIAFNDALEIAYRRSVVAIPRNATAYPAADAIYLLDPATRDILSYTGGGKVEPVAAGAAADAPEILDILGGADGPLIVRADLSVARIGSDGTSQVLGKLAPPQDFDGLFESGDTFTLHPDGMLTWQRWGVMSLFDTGSGATLVLAPEAYGSPLYYAPGDGRRYVVMATGGGDDIATTVYPISVDSSGRLVAEAGTQDAQIGREAIFANCFIRAREAPGPYNDAIVNAIDDTGSVSECRTFESSVLLSNIFFGSGGEVRTDTLVDEYGETDLATLEPFRVKAGANLSWLGVSEGISEDAHSAIAATANRDVMVGGYLQKPLAMREPEAPTTAGIFGKTELALVEPRAGRIVSYDFADTVRDAALSPQAAEAPLQVANFGTCVGYAMTDLVDRRGFDAAGRPIELIGGNLTSSSGPPGIVFGDGPDRTTVTFEGDYGCLQVSADRKQVLVSLDNVIDVYDMAVLATGDREAAHLSRLPGHFSSGFFIGDSGDILTASYGVEVERWHRGNDGWAATTVYSGDTSIGYAEPSPDGSTMIMIEFTDGGGAHGWLYSFEAGRKWLDLGSEYKWFGAAFTPSGQIATAHAFELTQTFRTPLIADLAAEAAALLPASCQPAIAGDYRSSPCWPASL